jgi:lipopolysaccharide cholinephosphotransferase
MNIDSFQTCESLRDLQLRMLDMLKYIDKICIENNISYWLSCGTLLGAVRHQGFIPWDDDLDIEMLKEDYDRLIKVLRNDNSDKYVLQTHSTDRNYISPITKLRDKNSYIEENRRIDINYEFRGAFVDIFYLENYNKLLSRLAVNLQKIPFVISLIPNDKFGVFFTLKVFFYWIVNKCCVPIIRLGLCFFKKRYKMHVLGTGSVDKINMNNIFPLKQIVFEGGLFNAPANTDAYLADMYGDYMKLPKEEDRRVHTIKFEIFK